ncbi:MAG: CDP-alcohol phosphatidyltransferase family protein [Kofleriaceae bacterium]|nr:CDP-alcohol phosphatidyltransferase family protein [Myxococcales bacterium]MCB9564998.1 CDP-alcohol phosphatidyltransferase family protein [Kofleriaceae bacterium]
MNLFAVRKHLDKVLAPLLAWVSRLPIHANTWTLIGAAMGLTAGVVFLYAHWWIGLVLLIVRGLVDHIDGYVARTLNQRSTFGAVMDDVCDRWVLGVMYAGGCLAISADYPHVLIVLGLGITGSLTNVIIKLSIYAESQQDVWREKGKMGHPIDVVGLFGSAEFMIYFGVGVLFTALLEDPRPLLAGAWAVAIMSHVSLLQRVAFAWRRYRFVDPAAPGGATSEPERALGPASVGEA